MARPFPVERTVGTSLANAAQTVSSPVRGRRKLVAVFVAYSAAVSLNVTVTLNAGEGAAYDTLLQTIPLAAESDAFWIPDKDIPLSAGDAIDVLAPAGGAGVTSAVMVYTEVE